MALPFGVIFDLDRTLVDSRATEALRKKGKWAAVLERMAECPPYPGIPAFVTSLQERGGKVGVVTNSPSKYALAVLDAGFIAVDALVCYHDTKHHKPDPEPMLLCAHRLGLPPPRIVCIGDSPDDIRAGAAAGCPTVGASWGAADVEALLAAAPGEMCDDPAMLLEVVARVRANFD